MCKFFYGEKEVIDSLKVDGNVHEKDIDRLIKYRHPACLVEQKGIFKIGAIQKKYNGELAYRVYEATGVYGQDNFGRVADFDVVDFIK